MVAARRKWKRWLALSIVVAGLAVAILLATNKGWLGPVYAWFWQSSSEGGDEKPGSGAMDEMAGMPGMDMPSQGGNTTAKLGVPGYAVVVIEPGLQQRMGLSVGKVQREPLRMSVEAVGIVRPDETKTSRIHLRTNGWVEELFVNFSGQQVQKGDRLLAIYSPEFLTAQEEYLVAKGSENLQRLGKPGPSLVRTSLQKLKLLGVPADEIRQLEQTGESQVNLTLTSPITGTVLEKNVLEGDYITPERELYVLSDLSKIWVQAKVYQYELPHVELGTAATVTVPGMPEQKFSGKVVFVQPIVEKATRTVQVRIELPNPQGLLKPDMFVHVQIEHPMGEGLLVPASAVIRTGERQIAFRAQSGNRFVPVEVEISNMKFDEERYHVLQGLEAGDHVVTSANFLIDSESRLRHGGGGMMPGMAGMEMDMPGMKAMDGSEKKH